MHNIEHFSEKAYRITIYIYIYIYIYILTQVKIITLDQSLEFKVLKL